MVRTRRVVVQIAIIIQIIALSFLVWHDLHIIDYQTIITQPIKNQTIIAQPIKNQTIIAQPIKNKKNSTVIDALLLSDVTSRRTTITKRTAGTITLSNICLQYETKLESVKLLSYQGNDNDTTDDAIYIMHHPKFYHFQTTPVKNELEWTKIIQRAEWISNDGDDRGTIWMHNWHLSNNPGHCMNDFAFSAALDLVPLENDTNTQPYYSHFVHAQQEPIMTLENSCTTICCKLFAERFGLIDYDRQVARPRPSNDSSTPNKSKQQHSKETNNGIIIAPALYLCFDQITFPRLEAVRHKYDDQINAGIQMLRRRSWVIMKNDLDSSPWPNIAAANITTLIKKKSENEDEDDSSNSTIAKEIISMPKVLLFDRFDSTTRHLVNAPDIVSRLQRSHHVQIRRMNGSEWSNNTLLQQAIVFNSYQYILTVHGAHLFNMMHSRPRTKVLEIQCFVRNPRWNLHQQWYSAWARTIGLSWRVHTEREGCLENGKVSITYSPKNIYVDVGRVVAAAVEHFDLKPR